MAYVYIDNEIEPYLDILIDCIKLKGKNIKDEIERIVNDTNLIGECLEDNFLNFKLHSKNVRDEYRKAVDEEIRKNEECWQKCDELIRNSKPSIIKAKAEINELISETTRLNCILDSVSFYKIENLIKLVERFNQMPDEDKKMLSKLLEISKKDEDMEVNE